MDPAETAILLRVHPSDLEGSVKALEALKNGGGGGGGVGAGRVEQWLPLRAIAVDGGDNGDDGERPFLQTEFNQVDNNGNAYQSPWTDRCYRPAGEGAAAAAAGSGGTTNNKNSKKNNGGNRGDASDRARQIRGMAEAANEVWDAYRQLYYGHDAVGSVFVREGQGSGPAGKKASSSSGGGALECLFGIHKETVAAAGAATSSAGCGPARWDCLHRVTVMEPDWTAGTCDYRVESAVWCSLQPPAVGDGAPRVDLAALLTKETARTCGLGPPSSPSPAPKAAANNSGVIPTPAHLENIGTMLEAVEMDFRTRLERVHMPKAVEVMQGAYRAAGRSGTVHLMQQQKQQQEGTTEPSDAADDDAIAAGTSEMGVGGGAGMIGEIAERAKSKGLGDDEADGTAKNHQPKVIESMAQKKREQEQREKDQKENNKVANEYTDLKAGLKKKATPATNNDPAATLSPTPATATEAAGGDGAGTADPWGGARAGLKSRKMEEGTDYIDLTSPFSPMRKPAVSSAATPEFIDFRNKLKSPIRK